MAIAKTLQRFLEEHGVEHEVLTHAATPSASRSAEATHVPGDDVAKAVLLKDEAGCLLAVLPASYKIQFGQLWRVLHRPMGLATEADVALLFKDCEAGAVPPVGEAYGVPVVIDETLAKRPDIYFEGGDHQSLVHVKGEQFRKLMDKAQVSRFSRHS
ncbi:MAG TPA: YbaK/EbsC family protein [Dongiaceae bacterium]|nr:YbaK/EbsC family protein [Dongiaceae bacterium]